MYDTHFMAKRLNLPVRTIAKLARKGLLPGAVKTNRRWQFDEATIELWSDPKYTYGSVAYKALGAKAPGQATLRSLPRTGDRDWVGIFIRDFMVLQFRAHRHRKP